MANMFRCTLASGGGALVLTVTCDAVFAGLTITATDGTTTLTQPCPSSSPYEVKFRLPNAGQWTISGVISGETQSITVDIWDNVILNYVPKGSTVTPTDDIQTWLLCAKIFDKNYTTITQVLNDASTLQALIASNNAVDYMARSTTWANDITSESSAMTYIGLNDYCADALLDNQTWRSSICNSNYFENVLNVKIPTMTSNTTPSGKASASTIFSDESPYKAFDKNTETYWGPQPSQTNNFLAYEFPNNITTYLFALSIRYYNNVPINQTFKLQESADGTNWTDIDSFYMTNQADYKIIHKSGKNRRYRIFCPNVIRIGSQKAAYFQEMQLYGRS